MMSRCMRAHKLTILLLALFLIHLVGCCVHVSMVDIPPLVAQRPLARVVAAHRGPPMHGDLPDNSLAAITSSVQHKIPFIEVDVRLSHEGELFLFHDGSLTPGNSFSPSRLHGRPIQSLSHEERSEAFLNKERSLAIPSFESALSAIREGSSSLQVDLKGESDALVRQVIETAQSMGLLSRVLVQVRNPERVAMLRKSFPAARILARCLSPHDLKSAIAQQVEFVELERWISSDAIADAHRAGIQVLINVATSRLDESATWEYFRSRGVDSITSDRAAEHLLVTPLR